MDIHNEDARCSGGNVAISRLATMNVFPTLVKYKRRFGSRHKALLRRMYDAHGGAGSHLVLVVSKTKPTGRAGAVPKIVTLDSVKILIALIYLVIFFLVMTS
mmetsp:Transcript_21160/g.61542  ORF Transcript_21160/g.61542 Transcript_21160/m.61542 type:complete len:102 (-) Transcript_21160:338-643(-)